MATTQSQSVNGKSKKAMAHHEATRDAPLKADLSEKLNARDKEELKEVQKDMHADDPRFEDAQEVVEETEQTVRSHIYSLRKAATDWMRAHPYLTITAGVTAGAGVMILLPKRGRKLMSAVVTPVVGTYAARWAKEKFGAKDAE